NGREILPGVFIRGLFEESALSSSLKIANTATKNCFYVKLLQTNKLKRYGNTRNYAMGMYLLYSTATKNCFYVKLRKITKEHYIFDSFRRSDGELELAAPPLTKQNSFKIGKSLIKKFPLRVDSYSDHYLPVENLHSHLLNRSKTDGLDRLNRPSVYGRTILKTVCLWTVRIEDRLSSEKRPVLQTDDRSPTLVKTWVLTSL
ncbi:hypothetical protein BpHYR1_040240, partial [Brachionus plicatilis]